VALTPMTKALGARARRVAPDDAGRERGAAAVEFAILLPILILLVFGIIQFGITWNRAQGLQAAAREGARLASLPYTSTSDVQSRVTSALQGVPLDSPPTVTVSQSCSNATGQTVTVKVAATTSIDIPLWGSQSVTLHGQGSFRCE